MRGDTVSAEERLAQLARRCREIESRLSEIERRLVSLRNEREQLHREQDRLQARIAAETERALEEEERRARLVSEKRKRPTSRDMIVERLYHKYRDVLGPVASRRGGGRGTVEQRKLISDEAERLDALRMAEIDAEDAVQSCLKRLAETDGQSEWPAVRGKLEGALTTLERIRRENDSTWADLDAEL